MSVIHPGLLVDKLGLHEKLLGSDFSAYQKYLKKSGANPLPKWRKKIFEEAAKILQEVEFRQDFCDFFKEMETTAEKWAKDNLGAMLKAKLKTDLAVGISGAAVMNTGITLHHTYGAPIIPGSSVKGTCLSAAREMDCKTTYELYGQDAPTSNTPQQKIKQGDLIFMDALPYALTSLKLDIINPHHQKYYAEDESLNGFYKQAPDVEEPVPVFFLTTPADTKFMFIILSKSKNIENIDTAKSHWKTACELGFGAKTSRGYGWFEPLELKNSK